MPPRSARLPRSGIKRKPRKASEFARIYHSRARVAFVKSLPCWACMTSDDPWGVWGPSDNAHTVTGGTGYKAGYETVIPLCRAHHERYDQYKAPFQADSWKRESAKQHAAIVESLWQMRCAA